MQPWSTQYARSLSLDQWPDEIGTRFVKDFANRIDSLPFRDPIKSTLATFGIEGLCWPVLVDWDIYTISFERPEITSLTFSAWFFATAPPWSGGYGQQRPEPVLVDEDGEETLLFAFDGILHINDAGIISSDVITIYIDPDLMPVLHDRGDDCIFSFHSF
jgi:hypothetical protein